MVVCAPGHSLFRKGASPPHQSKVQTIRGLLLTSLPWKPVLLCSPCFSREETKAEYSEYSTVRKNQDSAVRVSGYGSVEELCDPEQVCNSTDSLPLPLKWAQWDDGCKLLNTVSGSCKIFMNCEVLFLAMWLRLVSSLNAKGSCLRTVSIVPYHAIHKPFSIKIILQLASL